MARRWILRVALVGLLAAVAWQVRRARPLPAPGAPSAPSSPSAPEEAPAPEPTPEPEPEPAREPAVTWRDPVDGACPDGFLVKVNTRSGIAHVPGGRSYDRTVPDRCYATAADAVADGYRLAKA